jgi:hypothetical protein
MGGLSAVLFTAHIDITALAQDKEGQGGEHRKSNSNFPHTIFLKVKNDYLKKSPLFEGSFLSQVAKNGAPGIFTRV